jgi:hypothetical protein
MSLSVCIFYLRCECCLVVILQERKLAHQEAQKRLQALLTTFATATTTSSQVALAGSSESSRVGSESSSHPTIGPQAGPVAHAWKQSLRQRLDRISNGSKGSNGSNGKEKKERKLKLVSPSENNAEYDCSLEQNPDGLSIGRYGTVLLITGIICRCVSLLLFSGLFLGSGSGSGLSRLQRPRPRLRRRRRLR